jgi:hypothetical protein
MAGADDWFREVTANLSQCGEVQGISAVNECSESLVSYRTQRETSFAITACAGFSGK